MDEVENLLITTSCTAFLWWEGASILQPISGAVLDGLVINCYLCCFLSWAGIVLPAICQKIFRYDVQPCLHYCCVVVPAVFYLSSRDENNLISLLAVYMSFFFLIILVCCLAYQTEIRLLAIAALAFLLGFKYFLMRFGLYGKIMLFVFSTLLCGAGAPRSFVMADALTISHFTVALLDHLFALPPMKTVTDLPAMAIFQGCSTALFIITVIPCFVSFKDLKRRLTCFYGIAAVIGAYQYHKISKYIELILSFLQQNYPHRIILIGFWLFVIFQSYNLTAQLNSNPAPYERKIFHLCLLFIYIPGLLYDIPLLFISSACAFCMFVIITIIVGFEIEPLSPFFKRTMIKFTGKPPPPVTRLLNPVLFLMGISLPTLNIAPVYILFGFSSPIWFSCMRNPILLNSVGEIPPLNCFSGIISIGIGEAFSCYIDANYGESKITEAAKSVEGTSASVLSQLLFISIFGYVGFIRIACKWYYIIYVVVTVSLIEACTNQTTSLILPPLMYVLLG